MSKLFDSLKDEFVKFENGERIKEELHQTRSFINELELLTQELKERETTSKDDKIVESVRWLYNRWEKDTRKNLKSSNSAIAKFNKNILYNIYEFELNDAYIYKIDKTPHTLKLIKNAIKLHLIRSGDLDITDNEIKTSPQIDITVLNKFKEMNKTIEEISQGDLNAAITWAISHGDILKNPTNTSSSSLGSLLINETGNSNENGSSSSNDLEFNLHKLQYLKYYGSQNLLQAYLYAQEWFPKFIERDESILEPVSKLLTSILFNSKDPKSPYFNSSQLTSANFKETSILFSKKFCEVIGFSFESAIFLIILSAYFSFPTFIKFVKIKNLNNKLDWSSHDELPFEINLPDFLKSFHPIFICPVSKEETTVENPPMALPCHHIISKQSLQKLSRNNTAFKCPYCPSSSTPSQARQVAFWNL